MKGLSMIGICTCALLQRFLRSHYSGYAGAGAGADAGTANVLFSMFFTASAAYRGKISEVEDGK